MMQRIFRNQKADSATKGILALPFKLALTKTSLFQSALLYLLKHKDCA